VAWLISSYTELHEEVTDLGGYTELFGEDTEAHGVGKRKREKIGLTPKLESLNINSCSTCFIED